MKMNILHYSPGGATFLKQNDVTAFELCRSDILVAPEGRNSCRNNMIILWEPQRGDILVAK